MIRAIAALALALPLGGCVAGMVAGAAGSAIGSAARGPATPPAPPGGAPVFHGFSRNPGWVVDIFEDRTIFAAYGQASMAIDTPAVTTTFNGHRYESEALTIDIAHQSCRFASSGRTYATSVVVAAAGREYRGCGTELAAH